MKKIKYKVTGNFGGNDIGDIVDAYILIESIGGGAALVYHPKTSPDTCVSLEFCIQAFDDGQDAGYWVEAGCNVKKGGDDLNYVNIDSQRSLNKLAKNIAALKYRDKTQK